MNREILILTPLLLIVSLLYKPYIYKYRIDTIRMYISKQQAKGRKKKKKDKLTAIIS